MVVVQFMHYQSLPPFKHATFCYPLWIANNYSAHACASRSKWSVCLSVCQLNCIH